MSKKTYHIEMTTKDNGVTSMSRRNDGFNPFELMGVLEFIQLEIIAQLERKIKPDIIKRKVVKR